MNRTESVKWWREAKLGLFIRWGLHALTGQDEQVMYRERIPVREYEKRAAQLTAARFDPEEWVRLAQDAGMKYIVITAKGCDGFPMFRTQTDAVNVCEATPLGLDVVEAMAAACRRAGLRLGVHYAHACDWRHPLAQSLETVGMDGQLINRGNFWDYPRESCKNLPLYIDQYALAQLTELTTRYGEILTVRFDEPFFIGREQADSIRALIRQHQPGCLLSDGLSADSEGDYAVSGDGMPCGALWEAAAGGQSLCWQDVTRRLLDAVSRGGNLLVSAYPMGDGAFSESDRRALGQLGAWLRENGEAVYRAEASPFPYEPSWGRITQKDGCLYLIVTDPAARSVSLTGLRSRVRALSALAGSKPLPFEEQHDDAQDRHLLTVRLTGCQGSFRVIRVETGDGVRVSSRLGPDGDGRIALPARCAETQKERLRWLFCAERPGRYRLEVGLNRRALKGCGEREIQLEMDGSIYGVTAEEIMQSLTVDTVFLSPGRHVLEVSAAPTDIVTGCLLTPV